MKNKHLPFLNNCFFKKNRVVPCSFFFKREKTESFMEGKMDDFEIRESVRIFVPLFVESFIL